MIAKRGVSRVWARLTVLLLVLGAVVGGGCFNGPPLVLDRLNNPVCPTPDEVPNPFPVPLPAGSTTAVGRIEGGFSVTPTGEARYEMPLVVPPGRAGIEPKLAITYDSGAGDGPLGVGFAIAGFSVVNRCPRNVAQDGEIRAVQYDTGDAFCLDGLRLVEVATGSGFREYRTFPDTFAKVVAELPLGWNPALGPKLWRVFAKSGQIYTYGSEPDGRPEGPGGTVRAWWLTRAEDRSGNFVAYHYRNEPGEIAPDFIEYTGHPDAPPTRRVEFEYEKKPANARHVAFSHGFALRNTLRLMRIRTRADGALAREYRFTQSASATTGRLRLDKLEECAADGVCKPPTFFT